MITVEVSLGDRTYPVVVGPGARRELAALLPTAAKRVAIVSQAGIPLELDPGREHRRFDIGHGEAAQGPRHRRRAVLGLRPLGAHQGRRGGRPSAVAS